MREKNVHWVRALTPSPPTTNLGIICRDTPVYLEFAWNSSEAWGGWFVARASGAAFKRSAVDSGGGFSAMEARDWIRSDGFLMDGWDRFVRRGLWSRTIGCSRKYPYSLVQLARGLARFLPEASMHPARSGVGNRVDGGGSKFQSCCYPRHRSDTCISWFVLLLNACMGRKDKI